MASSSEEKLAFWAQAAFVSAGSSAGAGSEVFHVYRHLRRRENIRQQHIEETAKKDDLEEEFQQKLAKHRIEAEERTSKKRAKRYVKSSCKEGVRSTGS